MITQEIRGLRVEAAFAVRLQHRLVAQVGGMLEAPAPTVLVALGGLLPPLASTRTRTRPPAVTLAAVAIGAQNDLIAAPRAQEEAG